MCPSWPGISPALVFVYFFFYNILLTYVGHLLVKQYFTKVYRTSLGSNKMFLITTSSLARRF